MLKRECGYQDLSCETAKEIVSKLKKRGDLITIDAELFRMVNW